MISEKMIQQRLQRLPHASAGFKQLVREMGLRGSERRELEERLAEMVARGHLVLTGRDRYTLPGQAANRNLVTGRLGMHREGYGFVSADDAELRAQLGGDIFIPPHEIGSAMHGDQVLVEVKASRGDGRREGRILRILGRSQTTVVGVFHYGSRTGHNYVRPMDDRITSDVLIPRGMELPVAPPESPADRVIGGEARRRQWDDLEGLVVEAEITDWPTATQSPKGRVIEILGYEDDFGVDVEIVIRKHHLPHRFPLAALAEAQAVEAVIPAAELRRRRDFRRVPAVTIDGETARDFDDAVAVSRKENGNYELQVHIADVSHYVVEDSAMDREARWRGTSVYFPDRAVPMLPVELSTEICSLRPHLDRLVLSAVLEINQRGEIVGYELAPGVIRSAERMTYTDVALILNDDAGARTRYGPLVEQFELMEELALALADKRERRGSIDFDLPEPVIDFDEHGLMRGVSRSERNIAHRIIEEFMLAANEAVASYLEERRIASLYRVHHKPDAKRVYDFENIAAGFGYSLGVGALPIERFRPRADKRAARGTGRQAQQVEVPREVHITPRMYQKLAAKIEGKPEERILSYLMLRSLTQARYSEVNDGHFALAARTYTHFTSPIRRYPDLIVHRVLKATLEESAEKEEGHIAIGVGGPVVQDNSERGAAEKATHTLSVRARSAAPDSPWSKPSRRRGTEADDEASPPLGGPIPIEVLHEIAEDTSFTERRADAAERELLEWKKVKFMRERIGEDFDGLIVSVTKFGLFVELNDLFIEGLVPLASLADDRYSFHENTRQIIGQRSKKVYAIGGRVRVLVDRIDPVQRKIQFALLEETPSRAQRRHQHPKG